MRALVNFVGFPSKLASNGLPLGVAVGGVAVADPVVAVTWTVGVVGGAALSAALSFLQANTVGTRTKPSLIGRMDLRQSNRRAVAQPRRTSVIHIARMDQVHGPRVQPGPVQAVKSYARTTSHTSIVYAA